jgi:hypothetical protein
VVQSAKDQSARVSSFAHDRDGRALNWSGGTQMMDITPEIFAAIQRSGIPAHIDIDVPADTSVCLETGVYDGATGKAGTLRSRFRNSRR